MAIAVAAPLAACQGSDFNSPLGGTNATIGTLGGAAAGGLIGSQFGGGAGAALFTLGGTLAGGWLGNQIGTRFDQNSKAKEAQAEHQAVATNQPASWTNPDYHTSGHVKPTHTFTDASGRVCREYTSTIVIGGQTQTGVGRACQQPDGTWKMMSG